MITVYGGHLIYHGVTVKLHTIYLIFCLHVYITSYIYTYVSLYTEEYINYKLTCSHSKLANFTIIMNKWSFKIITKFRISPLSNNFCTLITM